MRKRVAEAMPNLLRTPDRASDTAPPASRTRPPRFSLAALLLITAMLAIGLAVYRSYRLPYWKAWALERQQAELASRIAKQFPELPRTVGPWSGVDQPEGRTPFATKGLKGWLWRRYHNAETGQVIDVALGVGPAARAEQLPLGLVGGTSNKFLFAAPAEMQNVPVTGREVPTQVANSVHIRPDRRLDMVFLRWAHWSGGGWTEPRDGSAYPNANQTVLQVGLFYRRDTLSLKEFGASKLVLRWPDEVQFARRLLSEIDRWVNRSGDR